MVNENGSWVFTPEDLANYINTKRGKRNLHPIENNVIKTRLMIKMQSTHQKRINFTGEGIKMDAATLEQLEGVINEQFDLSLKGDLRKALRYDQPKPRPRPQMQAPVEEPEPEINTGFGSRLWGLFGS